MYPALLTSSLAQRFFSDLRVSLNERSKPFGPIFNIYLLVQGRFEVAITFEVLDCYLVVALSVS